MLIRDLGSRNGVRVNGRLVDEVQLFPGDEVAIGPVLYRLEVEEVANPPRRAPAPAEVPIPLDPDSSLIPLVDL